MASGMTREAAGSGRDTEEGIGMVLGRADKEHPLGFTQGTRQVRTHTYYCYPPLLYMIYLLESATVPPDTLY